MEQPKNNLKIVADKKRARMILPNMLTLIGVCIGLTSIRFALDGRFELAIIAILFAALIDGLDGSCLLYTSPSPRDNTLSRMPSSA